MLCLPSPAPIMDPQDLIMEDDRSSHRKANKPLMEKRRRARINRSLMELKAILVESLKKSTPGHSKWEKADILEMTVQYLQCLKNQQHATKSDPLSVGQFIAGFSECIRQIQKFSCEGQRESEQNSFNPALQQQLTDFLLSYLKSFSDDATKGLRSSNSSPQSSPKSLKQLSPSMSRGKSRQDSGFLTSSPTSHHSPTSSSLSPKSPAMSPGTSSNGSSIGDSPRKSDSSDLIVSIPKPTPILHNTHSATPAPGGSGGGGTNGSFLTLLMNPQTNTSSSRSQAFHPYSTASPQGPNSTLLQHLQGPPASMHSLNGNQHHLSQSLGFPYPMMPGDHKDFSGLGSVWRPW